MTYLLEQDTLDQMIRKGEIQTIILRNWHSAALLASFTIGKNQEIKHIHKNVSQFFV